MAPRGILFLLGFFRFQKEKRNLFFGTYMNRSLRRNVVTVDIRLPDNAPRQWAPNRKKDKTLTKSKPVFRQLGQRLL